MKYIRSMLVMIYFLENLKDPINGAYSYQFRTKIFEDERESMNR